MTKPEAIAMVLSELRDQRHLLVRLLSRVSFERAADRDQLARDLLALEQAIERRHRELIDAIEGRPEKRGEGSSLFPVRRIASAVATVNHSLPKAWPQVVALALLSALVWALLNR